MVVELLVNWVCMCVGAMIVSILRALVLYWDDFDLRFFAQDFKNWSRIVVLGILFFGVCLLVVLQGQGILDVLASVGFGMQATTSGAVGASVMIGFFALRKTIARALGV